jgi:hypothetical protein
VEVGSGRVVLRNVLLDCENLNKDLVSPCSWQQRLARLLQINILVVTSLHSFAAPGGLVCALGLHRQHLSTTPA